MPDAFDINSYRFRTPAGRVRSRSELRRMISRLIGGVQTKTREIASEFHSGKINEAEFMIQMRDLLKAGHTIAASIGKGGLQQMRPSDWGVVGNKIRWQYKYLERFARVIAADAITGLASSNRAALYAEALHTTFYNFVLRNAEERGIDRDVPIGTDGKELMVRLIQHSQEGCEDCINDADAGWMPIDEMQLLGSRACGDFCKCEFEFSDGSYDFSDITPDNVEVAISWEA